MRLWRRTAKSPREASSLRGTWDFHSHILPGVDDGLRSYEEADAAIDGLLALGYEGLVLTPHIYPEVFSNTEESLKSAFATFERHVAGRIGLRLAAEYFVHEDMLAKIARHDLLCTEVGDRKLVLVEFPVLMPPPRGMEVMAALRLGGYQPVLAHIERYRYVQQETAAWLALLKRGEILIQCDLGSLVGQYGREPQKTAQSLQAQDQVDIWGTDLHRVEQIARYMGPSLASFESTYALNRPLHGLAAVG